ncbi:MAG: ribosome-associated translation inhibitor RaiA [Parachlamydiales bacterium]|jgi:putative sigma-54 modulation protein
MVDKSKFAAEGYQVEITGKNLQVTKAMQNYVLEKISKIQRFTNNILEIIVILEVQKLAHSVSIVLKFYHYRIQVHATTTDLYAAIDGAFDKLYKLILKYKNKLQSHRNKDLTSIDMKVHVLRPIDEVEDINDDIEEENLREDLENYKMPQVVSKEEMPLKLLTQEEAIMKLELSGEDFLIYKSEEDQKLKVIYKRKDENLGIVEVEG